MRHPLSAPQHHRPILLSLKTNVKLFAPLKVVTRGRFFVAVWREWNARAQMFCIGEVLDGDVNRVSAYQLDSTQTAGALDSVLNYPMYYGILQAFGVNSYCTSGMNCLSPYISATGHRARYPNPDLLGTFSTLS